MGASRKDSGSIDWGSVLDSLVRGEAVALHVTTRVIQQHLRHLGAYDLESSWSDITQEVLIAVLHSARSGALRSPKAVLSYIRAITRNSLFDWMRKHAKDRAWERAESQEDAVDPPAGISSAAPGDLNLCVDLQRALAELVEPVRSVVTLIYLQGFTYQETADRLGLSVRTVKRRRSQGLAELRRALRVAS